MNREVTYTHMPNTHRVPSGQSNTFPFTRDVSARDVREELVHISEAFRYRRHGTWRIYNLRVVPTRIDVWINVDDHEPLRTVETRAFTSARACSDWLRAEKKRLETEGWTREP